MVEIEELKLIRSQTLFFNIGTNHVEAALLTNRGVSAYPPGGKSVAAQGPDRRPEAAGIYDLGDRQGAGDGF